MSPPMHVLKSDVKKYLLEVLEKMKQQNMTLGKKVIKFHKQFISRWAYKLQ